MHENLDRPDAPGFQSVDSLLISVEEVASMLGISVRSVWRLLSTNAIPTPVKLRASVRWNRVQLEKWVDQGCPAPNNECHQRSRKTQPPTRPK
jgi:excisionase family DNA binding protein